MKKQLIPLAILTIFFVASCSSPSGEEAETNEATEIEEVAETAANYVVDATNSTVNWTGSKPTGEHHGTVAVESGTVSVENEQITGGNVVVDMTTITVLDIEDADLNAKLQGHLASPDFFSVDSFPQAIFTIASVEPLENAETIGEITPTHKVTGNLQLRAEEKSISFPAKITVTDSGIVAETVPFTIDRTKWGVVYNSGKFFQDLADKMIHDEIGLQFVMKANKE